MKKGIFVSLAILILAAGVIWAFSQYTTPSEGERASVSEINGNTISEIQGQEVKIAAEKSNFEFEGFAVGKSHVGTFDSWEGSIYLDGDQVTGLEGKIDASSANTGIAGLDSHLRSDDFFDTQNHPEITFTSTGIDNENNQITGNLEFRGTTKEITFPFSSDNNQISTEFFLDVTPFSFKYTGINKEVRVKFDFPFQ